MSPSASRRAADGRIRACFLADNGRLGPAVFTPRSAIRMIKVEDAPAVADPLPALEPHLSGDDGPNLMSDLLSFMATPAAVAWLRFEWFQSTLDDAALGLNEFMLCVQYHGYPETTALAPSQWAYLRALVGRPRRLSASFLKSERAQLDMRRTKIRLLQRSGGLVRRRLARGGLS